MKCIGWCFRCQSMEHLESAGPLFWRCTECLALVPDPPLKGDPDG